MSEAVLREWTRCRKWILPALEDVTEIRLIQALVAGRAQLWPGRRSAVVTEMISGDEIKLILWLAGGDLREILGMQPGLEAWARAQGAASAWVDGRKGWRRVMTKKGFVAMGDKLRMAL